MSQRGSSLPLSRPVLDWLCSDKASWSALPLPQRARLRWAAFWNSANARLSAAQLQAGPALEAPVLVLGPWRSGTTVMHELLAAATGLPTPQTWQCMNACSYLLLGAPGNNLAVARPMDGLGISPRSPQEDEFALLSLGAESAYRAFLMPHRIDSLHHTLDAEHWRQDGAWLAQLELFMRGCLRGLSTGSRRLLLKSPNHSFRALAMLDRWPNATIVWMARDPLAVLHSNRKMWWQMFETHALAPMPTDASGQAPLRQALDEFLGLALHRSAAMLDALTQRCAPGQLRVTTQVQLQHDAAGLVPRLLAALNLGPLETGPFELALARTAQGRVERYDPQTELPPALAAACAALSAAQAAAMATHGLPH